MGKDEAIWESVKSSHKKPDVSSSNRDRLLLPAAKDVWNNVAIGWHRKNGVSEGLKSVILFVPK